MLRLYRGLLHLILSHQGNWLLMYSNTNNKNNNNKNNNNNKKKNNNAHTYDINNNNNNNNINIKHSDFINNELSMLESIIFNREKHTNK